MQPERRRPAALPLVPYTPIAVAIVGLSVALALTLFGLVQLRIRADQGATEKARVFAGTFARRVRVAAAEDREAVVHNAARRTGIDLMLVNQQGGVLVDTIEGGEPKSAVVSMLVERTGFTETPTGRAAYAAQELDPPFAHMALLVFVHAPATPPGTRSLLWTVSGLALALVTLASGVSWVFTKNVRDEVDYVRDRIARMARADAALSLSPVPVRTLDQVGVLTHAFNGLLARFAAAKHAYEQDLEQASALDRARAKFLATLSHELRTPLNAILGFTDVLLSEVDGPLTKSAREDLEIVRSSGGHLRALIDDILDLSAIELGSIRLEAREIDAVPIASEVLREARSAVAGRDIALQLEAPDRCMLRADPIRLRQILANLVSNAVKFTAEGGVTVRIERAGEAVRFEVRDTGPGISDAEASLLFQEYRQVGDAKARKKGTGLGLAIAKRLSQLHDGRISLTSKVGKGTTFVVDLPVAGPSSSQRRPA